MFVIVLKTYSQTNISLFDVTLTNGNPTINFDVEKQFNKYHATILIPYSDSQFVENKETGAKRFLMQELVILFILLKKVLQQNIEEGLK